MSKELEAVRSESLISPDSIPNGTAHWAVGQNRKKYPALISGSPSWLSSWQKGQTLLDPTAPLNYNYSHLPLWAPKQKSPIKTKFNWKTTWLLSCPFTVTTQQQQQTTQQKHLLLLLLLRLLQLNLKLIVTNKIVIQPVTYQAVLSILTVLCLSNKKTTLKAYAAVSLEAKHYSAVGTVFLGKKRGCQFPFWHEKSLKILSSTYMHQSTEDWEEGRQGRRWVEW